MSNLCEGGKIANQAQPFLGLAERELPRSSPSRAGTTGALAGGGPAAAAPGRKFRQQRRTTDAVGFKQADPMALPSDRRLLELSVTRPLAMGTAATSGSPSAPWLSGRQQARGRTPATGGAVRLLHAIFVYEDETCFVLFEGTGH